MSRARCRQLCVISEATDLPVNADLENGDADAPREAAEMISSARGWHRGRLHEDATGDASRPIYDFALAVERARQRWNGAGAAVPLMDGARPRISSMPPGLADTIKRLQAFEKAGADVLDAPGVKDRATIRM